MSLHTSLHCLVTGYLQVATTERNELFASNPVFSCILQNKKKDKKHKSETDIAGCTSILNQEHMLSPDKGIQGRI